MTPDLVVLGNLLVDDIVFGDGRTRMGEAGGAVLYAAAAAALWGMRVGVCSLRGPDYPAQALDALGALGVDLSGVAALPRGLRTWLLYEGARRHLVHHLDAPTHTAASPAPDAVPADWSEARAFHLAPMPLPAQAALAARLARGSGLVSLDPHDAIGPQTMADWRPVLADTSVLWLGADELAQGDEDDPLPTLRALVGPRLRYVAWKRGPRGGWLYDVARDALTAWEARTASVVDPTGAGDAFAAGFLAGLLLGDAPAHALERAVVSASLALEDWGPRGLLGATPEGAERRRREWFPS